MTTATKAHFAIVGRTTRSKPGSSATFMSLPQRGLKKRKAAQAHVKAPLSPALSFSYSPANVHATTEAPSTSPPPSNSIASNAEASSSTSSAHKRRLIVDSDDEDPGPSANDLEYHKDNLAELNLINQVLDSHPIGSMSPILHGDQVSHVAAATAATPVAEPDAASVGADQDPDSDSTSFPAFMTIKLHFRRGKPLGYLRSIREWPSPTFTLQKSDTYEVLMAHIQQHLDELKARKPENRSLVWPEPTPYVQPTNSTNQQHYRPINAENYEVVLAAAWHAERRRLGAEADILVKMYVYLKDTAAKPTPSIQRARNAQARVEEANSFNAVDGNVEDVAPAGLYHELRQIHVALALLTARITSGPVQPEEREGNEVPRNDPHPQAGHLGGQRTQVHEKEASGPVLQQQHEMIRIKLNDHWVPVMMDIGDIRKALGFPPLDLRGYGDQEVNPPSRAPAGPDHVIDLDHEETPNER
ncbi:hypothetical protein BGZ68_005581 [Mortierella alpina]|nr:hypothetical protein BGZ68_005581 [Mortierella alpina]